MPISKKMIQARRGYRKLSHNEFYVLLVHIYECLLNNPHFPKPSIDLGLFKSKIDEYSAAISATTGGAKVAFAHRDSLREGLTRMVLQLALYVEMESHNDPAIFVTSGFESLPNAQRPPEPLERPYIPKIDHGAHSGEVQVWMPPSLRKILRYDVRYAPLDAEGVPTADWTETPVPSALRPVTIKNLKPGTRYAFQVGAYGKLGYTDWSDSLTKICT